MNSLFDNIKKLNKKETLIYIKRKNNVVHKLERILWFERKRADFSKCLS